VAAFFYATISSDSIEKNGKPEAEKSVRERIFGHRILLWKWRKSLQIPYSEAKMGA